MNQIKINMQCPEDLYKIRDNASYSKAIHETYHSNTTGLDRGVSILLPVNYNNAQKYPVLYMLHGIFGDEYTFVHDSKCNLPQIAENLYLDGAAKEMIIVFPNIYASSDANQKPEFNEQAVEPYNNFINDLVYDLIPYIEQAYSTYNDREHRAILGFSMGGRETLYIGLNRPDLFGYIGVISPAPGLTPTQDRFMMHAGQMKEEDVHFMNENFYPNLFLVLCGTNDSIVGKYPEEYHNLLTKNHVEHIWYEVPKADHDEYAIRSGFCNFISNIF